MTIFLITQLCYFISSVVTIGLKNHLEREVKFTQSFMDLTRFGLSPYNRDGVMYGLVYYGGLLMPTLIYLVQNEEKWPIYWGSAYLLSLLVTAAYNKPIMTIILGITTAMYFYSIAHVFVAQITLIQSQQ